MSKIHKNQYDLIISDIQLPGMNGIEMIEKLNLENPDFNTPIIVITADVSEDIKHSINSMENCDIITKPIQRNELNKILFEKIGNKKTTQTQHN